MDFSSLVGDVREKTTGDAQPPSLPQPTPGGFPQPKKRTRVSAFKAQRDGVNTTSAASTTPAPTRDPGPPSNAGPNPGFDIADERRRIDEENSAKLASMTPAEIARQRQELLDTLPSSLVDMLLRRANVVGDDEQSAVFDSIGPPNGQPPAHSGPPPTIHVEDASRSKPPPAGKSSKRVTFEAPEPVEYDGPVPQPSKGAEFSHPQAKRSEKSETARRFDDIAPEEPVDIPFIMEKHHYPAAPSLPDLDPNDPDFLDTLHKKYFPNLPADPSRLAWMAPLPTEDSAADRDSPYYPGQNSLPISALRFDFKGRMIGPKRARQIPVTKGLHSHAEAPEAAGYTIAELAIYARSAVPSQRCIAFQTLGRILFRLGNGEWGKGEVAEGIWASVVEGRVLDSLTEAATQEGGHRSSQAYATEALWLHEKGGWKQKHQGR